MAALVGLQVPWVTLLAACQLYQVTPARPPAEPETGHSPRHDDQREDEPQEVQEVPHRQTGRLPLPLQPRLETEPCLLLRTHQER